MAPFMVPSMTPSMAPSMAPFMAPFMASSMVSYRTPFMAPSMAPSMAPYRTPFMAPFVAPSMAPPATEVAKVAHGRFDRLRRIFCGPLATTCAHRPHTAPVAFSHQKPSAPSFPKYRRRRLRKRGHNQSVKATALLMIV